jgi:hypothetical protein
VKSILKIVQHLHYETEAEIIRAMRSSKFVVVTQLPDAGQNFDFSLKILTIYKQIVAECESSR